MSANAVARRPDGPMWPFLISPAGRGGNRPIILPDLDLGHDSGQRLQALVHGAADGVVQVRELDTHRHGHLTAVFRRVRAASDGTAHLWDLSRQRRIASLVGHVARVTDVTFSRDGALVATASWDHTVRVWDVRSAQSVALLDHDSWVVGCRFSPEGRSVVTATIDGTITTFDVASGDRISVSRVAAVLTGAVEINHVGRVLFVAAADHTIRAVRLRTGEQLAALRGHGDRVTACALAPEGRRLASASRDGTVRVWDLDTGREQATLTGHRDWVTGCAWPERHLLVSAGWDGALRRWYPRSEVLLQEVGPLRACAAVPGTGRLLVTGEHGRIVERHADRPDRTRVLAGDAGWIDVAGCSADGRLMVTGSHNDGPVGRHPFRDGFGRPVTMVEGVLLPGRRGESVLTDLDWQRVHAVCLDGLGIALTDERGQLVVRGEPQVRRGEADARPRTDIAPGPSGRPRRSLASAVEPAEPPPRRGLGCALPAIVAAVGAGALWEFLTRLLG
ncbi:WD40 repeat domain-containing protein [Micromonospora sp. NPDC049048]|uniref:WD40 repeat domain-containing protein n=1 Tax=Micromonospora sp. NPDC049048 TaxID=3364263 RepID=UPI003717AE6A